MSCPECFSGSVHQGKPCGKSIKLYGLDTYVSEPTDGRTAKGIIVIIPDGFGLPFVNNKILADHYAKKGDYKVYLPDFMAGSPAPIWMLDIFHKLMAPGFSVWKPYYVFWALYGMGPFLYVNRPGKSFPRVKAFFEQLRKEETLPIGAAGFCWGGKHVCLLGAAGNEVDGKPLYDAGFTGHPSALSIPNDIEKLTLPVSFAIGDKDVQVSVEQCQKIKDIVEAKAGHQKGELKVYAGASHGFCVRADESEENFAKNADDAEDQCIAWFNNKLKA